jgi:hypothetical protein
MAGRGGQADPLVVRTDDLRRVLIPIGAAEVKKQVGDDVFAVVEKILRPDITKGYWSKNTALGTADSILTSCGLSHCLAYGGSVPVYKNPGWSQKNWEREIRARGVDDPFSIVGDERPVMAVAA